MYICSSIANVFSSIRIKYHFGDYRKVGSMADIDPLVIEDIENGGCNIPRATLERLCDFYYIGGWRKSLLCTGRAKLKNGDELRIHKNKVYLNNQRVRKITFG